MNDQTKELIERMQNGDQRALARLMTYVDNRHPDLINLMSEVYQQTGRAKRIGVTGPPGAGKSTLVDKIIKAYRSRGLSVGIVAIDPSSPFSGGAVLGDRIRMQEHNADEAVFIRSLGSRGAHGGLSRATRDIVGLMDAYGFDVILIETVGVGQTELDIMSVAETTLVVLVPESGDTVQTMKAGLMEIADIFLVNKSDREGADRIFAELKALSEMYSSDWQVPVLKTTATQNQGLDTLLTTIDQHSEHCNQKEQNTDFLRDTRLHELTEVLFSELQDQLAQKFETDDTYQKLLEDLVAQKTNSYLVVKQLLQKLSWGN